MGRDFFITYWDLIADDVLAAFQEMFNTGIMPQMWKHGLICFITDEVKGWRPITLLNTIYNIVHKSQIRFMQERSILYNVFLF